MEHGIGTLYYLCLCQPPADSDPDCIGRIDKDDAVVVSWAITDGDSKDKDGIVKAYWVRVGHALRRKFQLGRRHRLLVEMFEELLHRNGDVGIERLSNMDCGPWWAEAGDKGERHGK